MLPFGRVVTAMATPFAPDGSLDLDGARRLAAHLVTHGTDSVLVAGTTGESPTLRADEVWDLLAAVQEAVEGRGQVLVGAGSNDTAKTVAMTAEATERGADGVLLVTPYYSRPSQAGLFHHFALAAGATDRPVLLYDIPSRTAREIATETLVELATIPNLVGVKDAAGDPAKTAEVVARTSGVEGGFVVYSGDDALNLPLLAVGAVGFVSVSAHLAGVELAEMAGIFETDPVKAREIHLRLMPLHRALFLDPSPGPLKGALDRIGLPAGPVRPPLADSPVDVVDAVMAAMDEAGIARP